MLPVAVASLLVHDRLIWLALATVAARLLGAGGGCGAAWVAAFTVLENPDNPGYGAAINRAAATERSAYLCAMNADVAWM